MPAVDVGSYVVTWIKSSSDDMIFFFHTVTLIQSAMLNVFIYGHIIQSIFVADVIFRTHINLLSDVGVISQSHLITCFCWCDLSVTFTHRYNVDVTSQNCHIYSDMWCWCDLSKLSHLLTCVMLTWSLEMVTFTHMCDADVKLSHLLRCDTNVICSTNF